MAYATDFLSFGPCSTTVRMGMERVSLADAPNPVRKRARFRPTAAAGRRPIEGLATVDVRSPTHGEARDEPANSTVGDARNTDADRRPGSHWEPGDGRPLPDDRRSKGTRRG